MIWIGPSRYSGLDPRSWGSKDISEHDVSTSSIPKSFLASQAISNWDAYVTLKELYDAAMIGNIASRLFGELLFKSVPVGFL